jgi:hypothetical protein
MMENKVEKNDLIFVLTYFSVPSKPTFTVTHRGTTFFNISFDPTIMTVPGSLYYVQYKENDKGLYKNFVFLIHINLICLRW